MSYQNFEKIKADYPIEQVAERLGLILNKGRCQCPVCESDDKRNLAVTPSKGWYSFAASEGGDCISLVAHVTKCSAKDAAAWIAGEPDQPAKKQEIK